MQASAHAAASGTTAETYLLTRGRSTVARSSRPVLACEPEGDVQMKIVMRDGRVQGTALQRFEEVELAVAGPTSEERATALVDEMLAKGSPRDKVDARFGGE
jgi:hypothetical protein